MFFKMLHLTPLETDLVTTTFMVIYLEQSINMRMIISRHITWAHPSQKTNLSALENGSTDLAENLNINSQGPLIK